MQKKTWHKSKGEDDEEDCEPCQALKMFKHARPLTQQPAQNTQTQQPAHNTQNAQNTQTHPQQSQHSTSHTPTTTPQNQSSTTPQPKTSTIQEAPPDLQELGRSTWTLLHTIAAYYPEQPSEAKKESVGSFITDISKVFPCHDCASDFQQVLKDSPPKLDNRKDFGLWLCQAHNHVNERLGKEKFDCSKVDERWRYEFPKDT